MSSGGTTNVDITSNAAFMSGKVSLTGSASMSQVNSLSINAYGPSGSSAGTSPNLSTGAYSLFLTDGAWSPAGLYFNFYDPTPGSSLNESLNFFDYQGYYNPTPVAAGQTLTKNLTYGTGAVTVNLSILGGGTFSAPRLDGNCYVYDANGGTLQTYSFYSYGDANNVANGSVRFVGMDGTCTVNAWAQVGGSSTKFGTLTLNVVAGTEQEVDLGGPSLQVTYPAAGLVTDQASIIVTGTAADDGSVSSVTVNGVAATLDPGPAPQVAFSSPVSLDLGPNQIVTVATDSSNNSSSDTRTVYRDGGAPTLSWSPVDQSTSNVAGVNVIGSADDDAGIASVTVNGAVVFQSSTPGSGPTHVDFNLPFTLNLGANFIEVVATDVSTQVTTQTHKVTYVEGASDTTPPVITAADVTVEATGPLTEVSFTATAADDVDPMVDVSCSLSSPALLGVGSTNVTCTATDAAGNDATASLTLTVVDTTPPELLLPENITLHALGSGTLVSFVVSATDLASGALAVDCAALSGSSFPIGTSTVACSATDNAGLTTRGSFTVTITNTVPSCGAVLSPSLLWPVNHKLVPIGINGVVDADGDAVAIKVTGIFQDEPTNTEGDGNTSSDATGVGTANPQVRAERAGTNKVPGNGRVYHIKFTATDSVGEACQGEVRVGVPHDQGGKSTPVDGGALYNSVTGARLP